MAARTLLDRAIAQVAPVWGASRAKARLQLDAAGRIEALAGDSPINTPNYGGGGQTIRGWSPFRRDAAGDTLRVLPLQRAQVRELVRTNPIAGGAIGTNVDRTVGTGLALVAQPNAQVLGWSNEQALEWKRLVQTEFSLWADSPSCDWNGEQNFYEKQGLTLRSGLESGDVFTLMPDGAPTPQNPYKLRLQTIEADRVGNPNGGADSAEIAGGIRRNPGNGVKSCYVYDTHPGAIFLAPGKGRFTGTWYDCVGPSGRRRVLHHFKQLRPEQPRGVPYLAPIIDHLKQLGRYSEAEIQAAVMSAFFTVFIETETGATPAPIYGMADEGAVAAANVAGAGAAAGPEIEMAPGAILGLVKGEKAIFANPQRPNAAFDPFVKSIVWQIGVGLGLPYEVLVKQFQSSYSASKAALLDAWMWFRSQRTWLSRSFCQPAYETWLAEAVASRRIAAPGFFTNPLLRWAYSRADWRGDSMGSINPKDEVEAYAEAIDNGLMTHERAEWELFGTDWNDTFNQKKSEHELLKAADLLPTPKAGAAAKPSNKPADPAQPSALEQAFVVLASREQLPPSVTIHQGDSHVHMAEGMVQLDAHIGPPVINLAEGMVQLEAHIEAPTVNVDNAIDVPPSQVTVVPAPQHATKVTHKRDDNGDAIESLYEPVSPTTH